MLAPGPFTSLSAWRLSLAASSEPGGGHTTALHTDAVCDVQYARRRERDRVATWTDSDRDGGLDRGAPSDNGGDPAGPAGDGI